MSLEGLASSTYSELTNLEDFDYMDLINNLCDFDKLRIDYEREFPTRPPSSIYPHGDHQQSNNRELAAIGDDHSKISNFHETKNICSDLFVEKNDGVVYQNKNKNPNNDVGNNKQHMSSSDSVNQNNSPIRSTKRKREKEKVEGENKVVPRCNCKKSECLKLYCECFASGVYCSKDVCGCTNCFNIPLYEDTAEAAKQKIISKNPSAFKKVKANMTTIASSSEIRGCCCLFSLCAKEHRPHCPCFQAGVACTINCYCHSCHNPYGERPEPNLGLIGHGNIASDEDSRIS